MKRLLFFIAVMIAISNFSFAQIAYRDAGILRRYIDKNKLSKDNFETSTEKELNEELADYNRIDDRGLSDAEKKEIEEKSKKISDTLIYFETQKGDTIWSILEFYFPGIIESSTNDEINNRLHENPFFINITYSGEPKGDSKKNIVSLSSISSVGSLNVTNIADGFAKFLVKRTKEELSVAFFEQFNTFISSDKYKDARILFPQTYATLQAIGSQIYNYNAYINSLRESFEKDLDGLLINLPKVIEDGRYKDFFDAHPDLKAICLSSLYVGNGLMIKEHPGKIIADFDVSQLDEIKNINVKASVQILQLFSESLRSTSTEHYWVPTDSLEMLIKDDIAFKIYLGLIFQQSGNIQIHVGTYKTFQEALKGNASNYTQYDSYLRDFIKQATTVTTNIRNISGKESNKLAFTDYYNFYNSALDLIQKASSINQLPGMDVLELSDDFTKYQIIARAGGNIALDINRKNYSSAVINVFTLYNYAFGGNVDELKVIMNDKTKSASEIESAKSLLKNKDQLESQYHTDDFKSKMLKFASFMASVTQAQNSDEIEIAIEAAALPAGSSRIKRESPFNVSLNAYTGLFMGHEKIIGMKDSHWINSYGLAAPIGVAVSFGANKFLFMPCKKDGHWSYSAFVSLIDLGAIAAFRFQNESVAQVPSIQLKDIFSPGLFLSVGFPKCPISFNLGAQIGPNLRSANIEDKENPGKYINGYQDNVYWRLSASILVDIPIFNLYTRSK